MASNDGPNESSIEETCPANGSVKDKPVTLLKRDEIIRDRERRIAELEREVVLLQKKSQKRINDLERENASLRAHASRKNGEKTISPARPSDEKKAGIDVANGGHGGKRRRSRRRSDTTSVSAVMKNLSVAMSVASPPNICAPEEVGNRLAPRAFHQFLLLSLDPRLFSTTELLCQGGTRYLDPIRFHTSHVLDMFPSVKKQQLPSMNLVAFSRFCFPSGVSVRLIPRAAMDGAKNHGWVGNGADKYHVLVFKGGAVGSSYGVAITTKEEVDAPEVVDFVSRQYERRRSSTIVSRWWRRNRSKNSKCGYRSCENSVVSVDSNRKMDHNGRRAIGISRTFKRASFNIFSSGRNVGANKDFRGDRSESDGSTTSFQAENPRRVPMLIRRQLSARQNSKEKSGVAVKQPSIGDSVKRAVSDVLEEFLRTSSIPQFDSQTQTGVWKSAKLRLRKKTKEYFVVIQHSPLTIYEGDSSSDVSFEPHDYSKQFRKETARLVDMLSDADIHIQPQSPSAAKPRRVSSIHFQEISGDSTTPTREVRLLCYSDESEFKELEERDENLLPLQTESGEGSGCTEANGHDGCDCIEESSIRIEDRTSLVQQLASEAYKHMLECEGSICVVERCYVLTGGKANELCLLFSALQQLIDSERDDLSLMNQNSNEKRDEVLENSRLSKLMAIQTAAVLSPEQEMAVFPMSQYDHVYGYQEFFELKLPFQSASEIEMVLPLPQVVGDWGVATLLLRIGPAALMKVLKLLILERSVLVTGESCEEVSCCTSALLDLLKPYEYPHLFLPLLPESLMHMVQSPVPFLVGIVCEQGGIKALNADQRIQKALDEGMCMVKLTNGKVIVSMERGEQKMFEMPRSLSEPLRSLDGRLQKLADAQSEFYSLQRFVCKGLPRRVTLTLVSVRKTILQYMTSLAGDIAVKKKAWQRYGKYNEYTDVYDFCPTLYHGPLFDELLFRKVLSHTQIFADFVHSTRNREKHSDNACSREAAARVIAKWLCEKFSELQ